MSAPLVGPHTPQLTAVKTKAAKLRAVWRRDYLHDGWVRAYIIGQAQDPDPTSDVRRRVALFRNIEHFATDRDANWPAEEGELASESNHTFPGSLTPIVCVYGAGPIASHVKHVILYCKAFGKCS